VADTSNYLAVVPDKEGSLRKKEKKRVIESRAAGRI
jgi:hypothetical protein